jgi:hypothetical protein
VDRCALFVDAGYALADGAMAVHGTRRRDSVSWDHAGLLKLLAGLARDRTGLPVLRCYWYEKADGGRTAEHDALAEMPGLKLRLVNSRPGRREGIESQLRRDIVTLAKSGAIADAFIASADEHVAEIVAEVQDLGLRVVVLHIASDGGWTIPQPLRQECDDIVEISGVHLRPFVDLIRGAEPATPEEQYAGYGSRSIAGSDGSMAAAMSNSGLPAQALAAPVAAYQAPAASDYRSAQPYATSSQFPTGSPAYGASASGRSAALDQALMGSRGMEFGGLTQNGPSGQLGGSGHAGGGQAGGGQAGSRAPDAMEQASDQATGFYGQSTDSGFGAPPGPSAGQSQAGTAGQSSGQHAGAQQDAAHGIGAQPAGTGAGRQHAEHDRGGPQHALPGQAQHVFPGQAQHAAQGVTPHHAAHAAHVGSQHAASASGHDSANGYQTGAAASGPSQPGMMHSAGAQRPAGGGLPAGDLPPGAGQMASTGQTSGALQPGAEANSGPAGQTGTGYPDASSASMPAQSGIYQNGIPHAGTTQNGMAQNGAPLGGMTQSGMTQSSTAHDGAPHGGMTQNGTAQDGAGQSGAAHGGYQDASASSGHSQSPTVHHLSGLSFPAGSAASVQNGYPGSAGGNGATFSNGYQGGYQNGSSQNGSGVHAAPGYQNGSAQNATGQYGSFSGYQQGSGQNGSQVNPGAVIGGAVSPAANGEAVNGDGTGGGRANLNPASFEAAPVSVQPSLYGPIDPGFFGGQQGQLASGAHATPGSHAAPAADQVRNGYAPIPAQPAVPSFQPHPPHQAQPHQAQPHQTQAYQPQPQVPSQQALRSEAASLPAVRAPQPVAISLSEAVKAAHGEGFVFGESVGRDAPGLWLEAVLARKPRMPSDLEARLLQGSVLPIDSLLHDEVRHSLRRGFWDALESARR